LKKTRFLGALKLELLATSAKFGIAPGTFKY